MPKVILAELIKKEQLKPNIFKFSLKAEEIARDIKPGQFIEVKVSDNIDPFLRRPISIYNADKENGIIEFIFRVQGIRHRNSGKEGTRGNS
ncbi:MAG: FAD-binding oxidoreductase [Firmicutes bacterium]|nr:FAD-binding oxidoreductase [Bacillota bacterium]